MKNIIITALTLLSLSCSKNNHLESYDSNNASRLNFSSQKLQDDSVVIISGYSNGATTKSVEIYKDGATYEAGEIIIPRYYFSTQLMPNGKILIFGGYTGSHPNITPVKEVEEYDPQTMTSKIIAISSYARAGLSTHLLKNGKVLVAGGTGVNGPINSIEVFDPVSNTFDALVEMTQARTDFQIVELPNTDLLLIGGYTGSGLANIDRYIQNEEKVYFESNMAQPRFVHRSVLLDNGKILTVGGYDNVYSLNSSEIYDPETKTSTLSGSMSYRRDGQTMVKLDNGNVLVAGGADLGKTNYFSEIYDVTSGEFSIDKKLPYKTEAAEAHTVNGDLIFFGGVHLENNEIKTLFFKY